MSESPTLGYKRPVSPFLLGRHHAGGLTTWPMMAGVRGDALFVGERQEHRLWLERRWGDLLADKNKFALWIGMNPSTAGADVDDLTIRKEQVFTGNILKLDRMVKVNVGSYCCTNPAMLPEGVELSHPENLPTILDFARRADVVVIATGLPPKVLHAAAHKVFEEILWRDIKPICLGFTDAGWPRHPSRLSYSTPFKAFTWPQPKTIGGKP